MAKSPNPLSSKSASSSSIDEKLSAAQQLIYDLTDLELRENALLELSKMRELFNDLAPLLWNSPCTIAVLLQEITDVYPALTPPTLTPAQSNRVCNALALLQCVASHAETRLLFLKAHLPLYLFIFLNTTSRSKPFEYLRLTTLGVVGALVKVDDTQVIRFLLSTEIVPLCLRTMEHGTELSRTVATFIVGKVLMDEIGLKYMCTTSPRLLSLVWAFGKMISQETPPPTPRLLNHIIRCYLRLTDNPRGCDALRTCLPAILKDPKFTSCLHDDPAATQRLHQLFINISFGSRINQAGLDHLM